MKQYSKRELESIHINRRAILDKYYKGYDGILYKGLSNGTLLRYHLNSITRTELEWSADQEVYDANLTLITSDKTYTGSNQRKYKICDGVKTWSQLDYFSGGGTPGALTSVEVDGITITGDGTPANPLVAAFLNWLLSVTDDSNGVVSVDNTDPLNPIIQFNGINVSGDGISGDGTSGSPLTLDDTLKALSLLSIVANSLILGTGTDTFSVLSFSANTFPARGSSGNLVAKTISDFLLSVADNTGGSNDDIAQKKAGVWGSRTISQLGADLNAVTGSGLWLSITTGNQSTTSASAQNITDLVFAVEANSRYHVMISLHIGCNNTGGVDIATDIPTGASIFFSIQGRSSSGTAFRQASNGSDAGLSGAVWNSFNNANGQVIIMGEVETGANAGNIQLMFASGVAGQTSTIYQLGTWVLCKKKN